MDKTGTSLVPAAARLRVAAVQMVFAACIEENLRTIGRVAAHLAKDGVDVVLFPECATTGYAGSFDGFDPGELRSAAATLSALAARHRIHLLVGSPILVGRRRHNALLVFDRRGRLAHAYAKCQLTDRDRQWFTPGDCLSLFPLDGVEATSILCHERRYPELVRIPVMAGARIVFHPNAGLDSRAVSRSKHGGRDGIAVRAFENAVFYVFANSVGPPGGRALVGRGLQDRRPGRHGPWPGRQPQRIGGRGGPRSGEGHGAVCARVAGASPVHEGALAPDPVGVPSSVACLRRGLPEGVGPFRDVMRPGDWDGIASLTDGVLVMLRQLPVRV